jgi:hypothetical protein
MAVPIPIPDLNLNMNTRSEAGDVDGTKRTSFSFAAPVVNKGLNPYLVAAGVVVAGGALFYMGRK